MSRASVARHHIRKFTDLLGIVNRILLLKGLVHGWQCTLIVICTTKRSEALPVAAEGNLCEQRESMDVYMHTN